jgi:transposase
VRRLAPPRSLRWARLLSRPGHRARLGALTACCCIGPLCGPIPPQYVKPFVQRARNDRDDAEAISEAAARPTMPSVAVKSIEQQAAAIILKHREMLVGQRTRAINALRGHAAECGIVAARGPVQVAVLLTHPAAHTAIPAIAQTMFRQTMFRQTMFRQMGAPIAALDQRGAAKRTDAATSGQRAQQSGNERLRQWLVVGAMAVSRFAKPGSQSASAWLLHSAWLLPLAWTLHSAWTLPLLERKPRKLAALALASKMARIIWARISGHDGARGGVPASAGRRLSRVVPRAQRQSKRWRSVEPTSVTVR